MYLRRSPTCIAGAMTASTLVCLFFYVEHNAILRLDTDLSPHTWGIPPHGSGTNFGASTDAASFVSDGSPLFEARTILVQAEKE